ncbi:putative protein isoform X1 [Capsicum annuum]|uniref:uncharacterized protein LOC107870757 isoform X1 n=1 Tax=Capsicum annuum TaxID=4072 RepID=UPI001FB0B157|nr:uncharacterized protein LOC107870757 isoform X1 [Capsicum annuum]XP_047268942.1 uncharacterized protein LOC107870757 isoform X1 [Capsicum annuum]XP_047268943.1 uncharacterized protein LOC107870757 isoform X1 [Capsicum annuum]XP_047268944.1 uncharacterized protein LOC107870757 isoform X1 [Capsicum annuum]XP_047268945.1 uncharacterized protein LOC107870757 isoform X1 [Capsicum annuum]XP_047268946.1 uncharacterized protein LOC107870757 isoform X1 [Capsicum annuum]
MKNNLVWKPNSPMPPQDFTVATYAYSPRQCFEERSASWPHKRSASLHEEDETEKERPQDTKDRFPRHEAAEKDESYVFLVNFKLTGLQEGKKKRCHLLKKRKVKRRDPKELGTNCIMCRKIKEDANRSKSKRGKHNFQS